MQHGANSVDRRDVPSAGGAPSYICPRRASSLGGTMPDAGFNFDFAYRTKIVTEIGPPVDDFVVIESAISFVGWPSICRYIALGQYEQLGSLHRR